MNRATVNACNPNENMVNSILMIPVHLDASLSKRDCLVVRGDGRFEHNSLF
jgi:hypothetical protein